ncbi:MAG: DNA adenine methylase [Magnetospirillum sp. WYHS-4]
MGLTDLERAARFLYLQRLSFGGKVAGRTFGVSVGFPGRFNLTTLERDLAAVHERLAGVVIECLPYGDFIARYDRNETLFYLDPPYWGSEGDYGKDLFGRPDFAGLTEQLAGIKGAFLMSINDIPEVRALFSRFHVQAVETTYTIGGGDTSGVPRCKSLCRASQSDLSQSEYERKCRFLFNLPRKSRMNRKIGGWGGI